jgi:hypothetical protein
VTTAHEPSPAGAAPGTEEGPLDLGHPKGTLAVVGLYALLFALGWLALYWFVFLPRGTPQP